MSGIFTINSDLDPAGTLTKQSIAESRQQNEAQNIKDREMMTDFYEGRGGKKEYLEAYGFETRNIKIPFPFINLYKSIINRTSLVYKNAPDRLLMLGETENPFYNDFLEENKRLVTGFKYAERYKNAIGSILYRPMWFNGKWNPWIETEWIPYFKEGDPLNPFAYSIPVKRDTTMTDQRKIEDKQMYMYWSKDYYYWHDENGEISYDPNYPDGKNPFGLIPFVELRKDDAVNEYWPDGPLDLVSANQAINITWCDLVYSQHNQAFSQPYAFGINPDQAKDIKLGADNFIAMSEPEMGLGTLDYNPKIVELLESIRNQIEFISASYGLNVKWSQNGSPASGFSLLVQNIELMEMREDDVERAEVQEDAIYDIIQRQDEVLKLGNKLPRRDKKTRLIIDFQELDFPINQKEKQERWDWEISHNAKTVVDYIQSDQGLSEDEARERFERNKELNQQLSFREKALKDEFAKQGAEVVNEP